MEIIAQDESLVVCLKPAGVLSTDEPGGVPALLREQLGVKELRTVHRLDRVVGGLMVLARSAAAASELSRQIREGDFEKEYLALVHGRAEHEAVLRDWMHRDKARKMSFVTPEPVDESQEAILSYRCLETNGEISLVRVRLFTGRTHQIRAQFAAHGLPLVGERKYSELGETCGLSLWSCRLRFFHPETGAEQIFFREPPYAAPWDKMNSLKTDKQIP